MGFFFFFPPILSLFSLSFKATPALFLPSRCHQTLAGSYGHETFLPLLAPKEEDGGERVRRAPRQEARRPARHPAAAGLPAAARTPARASAAPGAKLLSSILFAPAGRLRRLCVCAWCVCVLGGERRCLSQDPSLLKNAKESLLPQLPPSTRCSLAPAAPPQPRVLLPGCRAPLPLSSGSVSSRVVDCAEPG